MFLRQILLKSITLIFVFLWNCAAVEVPADVGRVIVPLHRQRVPVKSDTEAISYKSVYFGSIKVGSPDQQDFSVVFDTGSGHIIVPSSECMSATCLAHRQYHRLLSLHADDIDYDGTIVAPGAPRDQITVAFGTGEVTGQFVNDRLCLGIVEGIHNASGRTILQPQRHQQQQQRRLEEQNEAQPHRDTNHLQGDIADTNIPANSSIPKTAPAETNCVDLRIVMATEMSHEPFHAFAFDGVLGLGLDSLALAPEFSFFGMLAARGRLKQPSFGVFLADGDEEVSEISLGGHSPNHVRSELRWTPVASPELGYWQVRITAVRINNRTVDFCNDGTCRAVVDTGTSLLAVPKDFSEELVDELEGAIVDPVLEKGAELNCKHAKGAQIHFEVEGLPDGHTLTLDPGDYARPSVQLEKNTETENEASNTEAHSELDWENSERTCKPTIMPIDLPAPLGPKLFIWGEPVLRKYYTIYNWQDKTVGFGLAAHMGDPDDAPNTAAKKPAKKPLLRPLLL